MLGLATELEERRLQQPRCHRVHHLHYERGVYVAVDLALHLDKLLGWDGCLLKRGSSSFLDLSSRTPLLLVACSGQLV